MLVELRLWLSIIIMSAGFVIISCVNRADQEWGVGLGGEMVSHPLCIALQPLRHAIFTKLIL